MLSLVYEVGLHSRLFPDGTFLKCSSFLEYQNLYNFQCAFQTRTSLCKHAPVFEKKVKQKWNETL